MFIDGAWNAKLTTISIANRTSHFGYAVQKFRMAGDPVVYKGV
ncbi:MAG: hypothetical protein VX951_03945 [Planctomycetota bacterium]|nr:hypothetical protein [Planctomycetota bacterium]